MIVFSGPQFTGLVFGGTPAPTAVADGLVAHHKRRRVRAAKIDRVGAAVLLERFADAHRLRITRERSLRFGKALAILFDRRRIVLRGHDLLRQHDS